MPNLLLENPHFAKISQQNWNSEHLVGSLLCWNSAGSLQLLHSGKFTPIWFLCIIWFTYSESLPERRKTNRWTPLCGPLGWPHNYNNHNHEYNCNLTIMRGKFVCLSVCVSYPSCLEPSVLHVADPDCSVWVLGHRYVRSHLAPFPPPFTGSLRGLSCQVMEWTNFVSDA